MRSRDVGHTLIVSKKEPPNLQLEACLRYLLLYQSKSYLKSGTIALARFGSSIETPAATVVGLTESGRGSFLMRTLIFHRGICYCCYGSCCKVILTWVPF